MQENQNKPIVWTPEDAANLIGTAIREAQAPLASAVKRRSGSRLITFTLFLFMTAVIGGSWFYFLKEIKYYKGKEKTFQNTKVSALSKAIEGAADKATIGFLKNQLTDLTRKRDKLEDDAKKARNEFSRAQIAQAKQLAKFEAENKVLGRNSGSTNNALKKIQASHAKCAKAHEALKKESKEHKSVAKKAKSNQKLAALKLEEKSSQVKSLEERIKALQGQVEILSKQVK